MIFTNFLIFTTLSLNSLFLSQPVIKNVSSDLELKSKSAVLMECSTKTLIYEKNKDIHLNPASITKIMTLLIIFEELDKKNLKLTDKISVSTHAKNMGGSQVFLEEGETQTLQDMIKCICIASANDACVAVSEHIAGSEEDFVKRMNSKAKELGMKNTNFKNCCGLDTNNHYSSAYDIALMSRELITKHPEIKKYTTTWMDSINHNTKKGSKKFTLTNTNKLVRTYNGITGLKTGSTNLAKYCLSATATRNNIDMLAVVMSAPEHKLRYSEAAKLLDYGFSNCHLYSNDGKKLNLSSIPVKKGLKPNVNVRLSKPFSCILTDLVDKKNITYSVFLKSYLPAPVRKGENAGFVTFFLNSKKIGSTDIITNNSVKKATYIDYIKKIFYNFYFNN